ncbi:hypothetical protein BC941DRAFT_477261 [Chlamydoabsidia padenii]|nr:hypothetical protein BC941DRAFT_477261 [Chlamydoabsidia padenii]
MGIVIYANNQRGLEFSKAPNVNSSVAMASGLVLGFGVVLISVSTTLPSSGNNLGLLIKQSNKRLETMILWNPFLDDMNNHMIKDIAQAVDLLFVFVLLMHGIGKHNCPQVTTILLLEKIQAAQVADLLLMHGIRKRKYP